MCMIILKPSCHLSGKFKIGDFTLSALSQILPVFVVKRQTKSTSLIAVAFSLKKIVYKLYIILNYIIQHSSAAFFILTVLKSIFLYLRI